MRKQIGVGLVGYKFMGKAHSNAYRKIGMFMDPTADIEMRALCGRDETWVARSAKTYGWSGYETDWRRLIARDDIDMIDITAPSDAHMEIAVAAARAGKHVFTEKPMALNASDAFKMLEAAEVAGIRHQIGFNYRFAPAVLLAKHIIDEGRIGKVFHFRGQYLQDFIIDPLFPRVWRLDKSVAGSGAHGDLGAHVIDLARFLVGEIATVSGKLKTFIAERPAVAVMQGLSAEAEAGKMAPVTVDDAAMFMAEFANGALGLFESSRFSAGHKNALRFEINGDKGSLIFELERLNELQFFSRADGDGLQGFRTIGVTEGTHPYLRAWWPPGHIIGYEHTFVHELYEFAEAIAQERPASPDFRDGVRCSLILDAVEESSATGRWVNVPRL